MSRYSHLLTWGCSSSYPTWISPEWRRDPTNSSPAVYDLSYCRRCQIALSLLSSRRLIRFLWQFPEIIITFLYRWLTLLSVHYWLRNSHCQPTLRTKRTRRYYGKTIQEPWKSNDRIWVCLTTSASFFKAYFWFSRHSNILFIIQLQIQTNGNHSLSFQSQHQFFQHLTSPCNDLRNAAGLVESHW